MATTARIEANRRNAQHSTGPRTPEGKAKSSQNALKHGIRAQSVLDAQFEILGEDPTEFATLLQALVDDLRPQGPLEDMCVESIALGLWRHRRILRAEMGYIARRQAGLPRQDDRAAQARVSLPDFDIMDKLMRYETHLDRQINAGLARLTKLQTMRYLRNSRDSLVGPIKPKMLREYAESSIVSNYAARSANPSVGGIADPLVGSTERSQSQAGASRSATETIQRIVRELAAEYMPSAPASPANQSQSPAARLNADPSQEGARREPTPHTPIPANEANGHNIASPLAAALGAQLEALQVPKPNGKVTVGA